MRRRSFVPLAVVFAVALIAVVVAPGATAGGRPLSATLTGAAEVPGPGDTNGAGSARITLNQGQGTVCFELEWSGLRGAATAAHIHVGAADVAGPVVVGLFSTSRASPESGCIEGVDRGLIKNIRKNPDQYYVNIHTAELPGGAIRGQLGK